MITSDIKSMKTYMGPETAVNAPAETERSMGEANFLRACQGRAWNPSYLYSRIHR